MRFIAPAALLLATSLCGAQQAPAQEVDEAVVEPPIIIDSDSNRYDLRSGLTRFSDNVRIQRGAMEVRADEGVVHQTDGRYTLIELFGSPTTWRDRLDDGSIVEGRAGQIQYDVIENVVTLTGDARLKHEQGEFTGDELVYDLDTESLAGRGSSDNQARVILEGDSMRREGSGAGSEAESDAADDPADVPAEDPAAEDAPESGPGPEADTQGDTDADADGNGDGNGNGDAAAETGSDAGESETDAADAEAEGDSDSTAAGDETASEPDQAEDEPVDPPAVH